VKSTKLFNILLGPVVSEKSTMVGEAANQTVFKVRRDATKSDVKNAVELLFKVKVDSVQILNSKGKEKRYGKTIGRRDHTKKAYVCLATGEEINFAGSNS
jgi:large subunit ribosomal protein L23